MTKKLMLTIAMTSLIGLNANVVIAEDASAPQKVAKKEDSNGGKCASGKCGTAKIYGKAEVKHDPQDYLVRARDGKCGLHAQGISDDPQKIESSKYVSGVCGQ